MLKLQRQGVGAQCLNGYEGTENGERSDTQRLKAAPVLQRLRFVERNFQTIKQTYPF